MNKCFKWCWLRPQLHRLTSDSDIGRMPGLFVKAPMCCTIPLQSNQMAHHLINHLRFVHCVANSMWHEYSWSKIGMEKYWRTPNTILYSKQGCGRLSCPLRITYCKFWRPTAQMRMWFQDVAVYARLMVHIPSDKFSKDSINVASTNWLNHLGWEHYPANDCVSKQFSMCRF